MITADTSAWVEFTRNDTSSLSDHLEGALRSSSLVMVTPVLFEILSGPGLTHEFRQLILHVPVAELIPGFWERAGTMRATILKKGFKARAMDCLIAQACIDHDLALIARDKDFRHFEKHGLRLAN